MPCENYELNQVSLVFGENSIAEKGCAKRIDKLENKLYCVGSSTLILI